MEITFVGHACFKVKSKNATLVFDPYDPKKVGYNLPKLTSDILLISHQHGDHNYIKGVSDYQLLIDSPGEYEMKDVYIVGFESFHDANGGKDRGKNTMFLVEIEGVTLLHLGDLGHELDDNTLSNISRVDVLLIPVGGVYTIDPKVASKVISSLEPGFVVPMHYQTKDLTGLSNKLGSLDDFLEELGSDESAKKSEKLVISGTTHIPEESEVVVLKGNH
jgi:L-ascorbate metabolism protein UlaG (beta-lactamase superfamily)